MSIGGREKRLIMLAGILVLIFLFSKNIWIPSALEIREKHEEFNSVRVTIERMNEQIDNIEGVIARENAITLNNKRLDKYLLSSGTLIDVLTYIETIIETFEKNLQGVRVFEPEERVDSNSNKYYEYGISFRAEMTYPEIIELSNFIESGTKLAKVTQFRIEPSQSMEELESEVYTLNATIAFYSLEKGNLNEVYNFSRNRFTNIQDSFEMQEMFSSEPTGTSTGEGSNASNVSTGIDFRISLRSALRAGDNLKVFDGYGDTVSMNVMTTERRIVELNLSERTYTATIYSSDNQTLDQMSGALPQRDMTIRIDPQVPDLEVNENLSLDVKIINNSGRGVSVNFTEPSTRVRVLDRNNDVISRRSNEESTTIS